MPIKMVLPQGRVPVKIWTNDIAENAQDQLANVANLPFVFKHVAAMPDAHYGMGATVGSVIPTQGAICPSAIGVDIGCGILAQKTSLRREGFPTALRPIREAIEAAVPHGFETVGRGVKGSWGTIPGYILSLWFDLLEDRYFTFLSNCMREGRPPFVYNKAPQAQLGTLGGGNHFIELCFAEEGYMWILIHSGSRGIGNAIGRYFIDAAKQEMKKWFIDLLDPDLAYLVQDSDLFTAYMRMLGWATEYARINRQLMVNAVSKTLSTVLGNSHWTAWPEIDCCHNYVNKENHYGENVLVTRKGAIRARDTDMGVSPGSMGGTSYIVQGLGNKDSFCSCSHGAGRRHGRRMSEVLFSVEDLVKQTEGVECKKDLSVLDEIPSAYKDLDTVMENQSDLCTVVHTLKAVLTVKG